MLLYYFIFLKKLIILIEHKLKILLTLFNKKLEVSKVLSKHILEIIDKNMYDGLLYINNSFIYIFIRIIYKNNIFNSNIANKYLGFRNNLFYLEKNILYIYLDFFFMFSVYCSNDVSLLALYCFNQKLHILFYSKIFIVKKNHIIFTTKKNIFISIKWI